MNSPLGVECPLRVQASVEGLMIQKKRNSVHQLVFLTADLGWRHASPLKPQVSHSLDSLAPQTIFKHLLAEKFFIHEVM